MFLRRLLGDFTGPGSVIQIVRVNVRIVDFFDAPLGAAKQAAISHGNVMKGIRQHRRSYQQRARPGVPTMISGPCFRNFIWAVIFCPP